jgi:hypothetical protein
MPLHLSIWSRISDWASLPRLHPRSWKTDITISVWFSELSSALPQAKCKGARSLVILTCWTVWCELNTRIFDRVEKDWVRLVSEIQSEARQWIKAGTGNLANIVGQSQ